MTSTTAITVAPQTAPAPRELLRPIARPAQVLEAIKETRVLIKDALVEGTDYGRIPGTPKNTLLKPGAEKIAAAFGVRAEYDVVDKEVDHDRVVEFMSRKGKGTAVGLYRYVVRCQLVLPNGNIAGTGLGACSTMETKYIYRPRDAENTALKMACKRAHVAAVLGTFGLSEAFTQDVGDDEDDVEAPRPRQGDAIEADEVTTPPPAPKGPSMSRVLDLAQAIVDAEHADDISDAFGAIDDVTGGNEKLARRLEALISERSAQLADVEWDADDNKKLAAKWLRDELAKRG